MIKYGPERVNPSGCWIPFSAVAECTVQRPIEGVIVPEEIRGFVRYLREQFTIYKRKSGGEVHPTTISRPMKQILVADTQVRWVYLASMRLRGESQMKNQFNL